MSLPTDVKLIAETVLGLEHAIDEHEDLESGLVCHALLEETARELTLARQRLTNKLAEKMPEKQVTVMGTGTFERSRKADRKEWNREALLRDVLDTRLVNPNTGEVRDETPLEKVLAVWNLGPPRVTVVRERGLDPEDYCVTSWGGWSIRVYQ